MMVSPSSIEASVQQSIAGVQPNPFLRSTQDSSAFATAIAALLHLTVALAVALQWQIYRCAECCKLHGMEVSHPEDSLFVSVGQSVDQHLLTNYHQAILSVILAQFSGKGFSDGMEGIVRLVEGSPGLKASSFNRVAPVTLLGLTTQIQQLTVVPVVCCQNESPKDNFHCLDFPRHALLASKHTERCQKLCQQGVRCAAKPLTVLSACMHRVSS